MGGSVEPDRSSRRWFGIRASRSCRLSDTFVRGLPLTIFFTSHISVASPSSSRTFSLRRAFITFCMVRMHRSHTPPWLEPAGGLKIHWTLRWRRNSVITSMFQELLLASYKISAIIWSHLLWLSSSGDETMHAVDEGVCVQAVDYLNVDHTCG